MPRKTYPYRPDYLVGPGEVLAEHIDTMNLTVQDIAKRGDIPSDAVEAIIACRRSIDEDLAGRLEAATGLGVDIWLALEARWNDRMVSNRSAGASSGAVATSR